MNLLQTTSLLFVLAAFFGAINYLFLKLPSAIGILIVSLAASLVILGLDLLVQGFTVDDQVRSLVGGIAFSDALLEGMLGLLLLAGALHVKLSDVREQWRLVALMATIGVALSTVIVGFGFSWLTGIPDGEWTPLILTATYVVVIFSILVQGLTVARLANRLGQEPDLV